MHSRTRIFVAVLSALTLLMIVFGAGAAIAHRAHMEPAPVAGLGPAAGPAGKMQPAQEAGPIRVAYLYQSDEATGEEFRDFLTPAGYDVSLVKLMHRVYLPAVLKQDTSTRTSTSAESGASADAAVGLNLTVANYDMFIIADDTNGQWDDQRSLAATIRNSGKPVVALGRGGHEFLGVLGLPPGAPSASVQTDDTLVATDRSQSRPFYQTPNSISLDQSDSVQVLTSPGSVVAVPVPAQPDVIRVGGVAQDGPYPVVVAKERFTLWGFVDGPNAMTDAGRNLFLNTLWFRAGDLTLPIKGANFVPAPDFDQEFLQELNQQGTPLHAFVQLDHVPSPDERQGLADRGVTLQSYLGGTVYAALIDPASFPDETFFPDDTFLRSMIRWLGGATAEFKVDPNVSGTGTMQETEQIDTVLVHFFNDVSREEAAATLSQHTDQAVFFNGQTWEVPRRSDLIDSLAQEEDVRWIGLGPPPPQDVNDTARAAIGTNDVQDALVPTTGAPTYLGLTGEGVVIGHFERGSDSNHPDLAGRVSFGANAATMTSSHATHVAGIMIGSGEQSSANGGTNRQWRGHAPGASIVSESYSNGGWPTGNIFVDYFSDAIRNFGAEVTNHSYVMAYGDYDGSASAIDQIVRGDATDSNGNSVPAHLAIWAAANQGVFPQYDDEEGFYSIYSPAKNSLSVGSIDSSDRGLSMFSSRGPTFDGRIKPDVVAPGSRAWDASDNSDPATGITSTVPGTGYGDKSGTSMAAPATAGVTALMLEQYHRTYGPSNTPLPATLKALLVNTADDLVHTSSDGSDDNGPDLCRSEGSGGSPLDWTDPLDSDCWVEYGPGPDFATGYGAINALDAVNAVRGKLFVEDSLSPSAMTDTYTVTVPSGRNELRFTLAWDDEPGNSSAPVTSTQLINDLDLRLISPTGTTHFPFTLDPLPATNNLSSGGLDPIDHSDIVDARRGDDDRNNVEQVLVNTPAAGTWTVQVTIEGAFPTGQPQSYALAGDFRTFSIADPTSSNPADAGSTSTPATFLVRLKATQPYAASAPDTESTFVDAQASDFQVDIDGTAATIVNGQPVGDQFWLMVRPQSGVYSPGTHNLSVTWQGYGTAQQTNAVSFTTNRTADRVVVVDHSGSMSDYDKMRAAQNAGRLFIDQALAGDRVAVVGFSTNASTPYSITVVSSGSNPPELQNAKNAIDTLTPTNRTAIGKGLLEGKAAIDTPGGSSTLRRMVLLSDGMENVSPDYATPSVRGVISPTDIVVDAVAVGPSSAGQHSLLQTIASDNSGTDYHVTETGFGATSTEADMAPAATFSQFTWVSTLENRLADQYKHIAEDLRHQQRLWQVSGSNMDQDTQRDFDVRVDQGLNSATFAINWAPGASMRLELESPSGRVYSPSDGDVLYRSDKTHETWIVGEPEPGLWRVSVINLEGSSEFIAWASARTNVDFRLFVGTPPNERAAGEPVRILGVLQDGEPIRGADVVAEIRGPNQGTWEQLRLYDDGQHGDGNEGDGIYGNWYLKATDAGNYGIHARAEGDSNLGQPFLRYANRTFHVRPAALYVDAGDTARGAAYENLLEDNSWVVDVRNVDAVPRLDVTRYDLVIIDQATGSLNTWGTSAAFNAIVTAEVPVLGLNEGGYSFFGRDYLGLTIGWPNGAHGSNNQIGWNRPGESIWAYPYGLRPLPDGPLTLYKEQVPAVGIFLDGEEPSGIEVYGWRADDPRYADVVRENGFFTLWSFAQGPDEMTETGRHLFVNTAYFTAFGSRP